MSAKPSDPADGTTPAVALAIAADLREQILSRYEVGDHLGSEDVIIARYNVSRPTFRQAMRILQTEGLVRIRRGNGGGFFASTPSARVVTRSASALLRRQGADLRHLLDASRLVAPELAALAAERADHDARQAFAAFVTDAWRDGTSRAVHDVVDIAVEVGNRLGALSGNPALALFATVLSDLVAGVRADTASLTKHPKFEDYIASIRDGHTKLAIAVRNGDGAAAREAMFHLVDNA